MSKLYSIFLEGKIIGTTYLENGDVSMGVALGGIQFSQINDFYKFMKTYCKDNNILTTDEPEEELIMTHGPFEQLKVYNEANIEIKGAGIQVFGSNKDGFQISIEGVYSPPFEDEFPHHVIAYKQRFK